MAYLTDPMATCDPNMVPTDFPCRSTKSVVSMEAGTRRSAGVTVWSVLPIIFLVACATPSERPAPRAASGATQLRTPPQEQSKPKAPDRYAEAKKTISRLLEVIKAEHFDVVDPYSLSDRCIQSMLGAAGLADQAGSLQAASAANAMDRISGAMDDVARVGTRDITPSELTTLCANGMLAPRALASQFMNREGFDSLRGASPNTAAIGVEFAKEDDWDHARVVRPIPGSPASRAGMRAEDRLLEIDGKPVAGMGLDAVFRILRGPIGSDVVLKIIRPDQGDLPFEVVLTREKINIESVSARRIESDLLHIRISVLDESTPAKLAKELGTETSGDLPPYAAVILDLRGNQGGLLRVAVAVAAAFLREDSLVLYTDARTAHSKLRLRATPGDYDNNREDRAPFVNLPARVKEIPLAVLIDSRTAAGAEAIAAALKDHGRAKLAGARTMGLGKVSTIIPLAHDTAVKLFTASIHSPKGTPIDKGVEPDVPVDADPSLREFDDPLATPVQAAIRLLRSEIAMARNAGPPK